MSKDIIYQRVLENKCPICGKDIKQEETVIVPFTDGKIEIHKRHIKYKEDQNV